MSISSKTFNSDCDILKEQGLRMQTSLKDYLDTKCLFYVCQLDHQTRMARTSFLNKKRLGVKLCTLCKEIDDKSVRFEDAADKIKVATGHILLKICKGRNVSYECGTCKTVCTTSLGSLLKPSTTKYCHACVNANLTKKSIDDIRAQLDECGLTNYELIEYLNNKAVTLKCPDGHEFVATMNDLISRNRKCPECSGKRRAETNLAKYGHENAAAAPEIKTKIEKTLNDKYGGHHMKLKEIRDKRDGTMMELHGISHAFRSEISLENARAACMEKYGVEYPLQANVVKEKIKENSRAKFGTDHPMQNAQECERRQHVWHIYKFPSGRTVRVQGYEPEFINVLLSRGVDESDIITERRRMPEIRYDWVETKNNEEITHKNSVYFPDMRVGDRLYEVKSIWTYELHKLRNTAKFEACKEQGYELDVVIFKNNKTIAETLEYRPKDAKAIDITMPEGSKAIDITMPEGSKAIDITMPEGSKAIDITIPDNCQEITDISDRYEKKRFYEYKSRVLDRNGHILLEINGKKALYECGSCGIRNEKLLETVLKRNGSKRCMKCTDKKNRPSRKTKESAQTELDDVGMRFTIESYVTSVNITVRCEHGHVFKSRLNNLIHRRKCPHC
jgi:hypothetical protein